MVVGAHGEVLTSAHVFARGRLVRAMLRDRRRPGYTVLDGGLGRYLAEHRDALVDARIVDVDERADLALIRLSIDTSRVPRAALRAAPLVVGERVVALGHPGENVWSLSSGVVAALPHGAIQHDAALGEGSSGGPLLDAEGRLVGIDIARVIAGAERVGYARPASAAIAMLARNGCPIVYR
jgi:S1-C subfamily serine protease